MIAVELVALCAGCSIVVSDDETDALDEEVEALFEVVAESNPSSEVCNRGGDQRQCIEASAVVIDLLGARRERLDELDVDRPSRDLFVDALDTLIAGLERRNDGLTNQNNDDFIGGNETMMEGSTDLEAARQVWLEEKD